MGFQSNLSAFGNETGLHFMQEDNKIIPFKIAKMELSGYLQYFTSV